MVDLLAAETFFDAMSAARVAGDTDTLIDYFADDAVFSIVGVLPEVKGKAAIHATLRALIDQFQFVEWTRTMAFVEGDRTASRHRLKVRHGPSGTVVDTETCEFLTLRDGKCTSFVQFADSALVAELSKSG